MPSQYPRLDACDPRTCTNAMIRRTGRVIDGIYRKHLAPFDITSSQLSILFVAAKGGALSQVEVARMLSLERSSMNRNLTRLVKGDLIRKVADRRLQITPKGRQLLEHVIPSWENAKAEVHAMIGDEGLRSLQFIQHKMTSS